MVLRPVTLILTCLGFAISVQADPPEAKYVFPAGGRRGTSVPVRIGGCNFHDRARFHLSGTGIQASTDISRTKTQWFEGPVIPQPASQAKEDYPLDYANLVNLAPDAPPGLRWWRVSTSQGVTNSLPFVIGDLPEVVEEELPGEPAPIAVKLPVTVNGRIFPREDIDIWTFEAEAGQTVTCAVDAQRLGSALLARLELVDRQGQPLAETLSVPGEDAQIRFTAKESGTYSVRIHDVNFGGLQNYVYRLTMTSGPYVDSIFPAGGRRGTDVAFELTGANLAATQQTLKLPLTSVSPVELSSLYNQAPSLGVKIETDNLPEFVENDAQQTVTFPAIVNGRISRPGQVDQFEFQAKKGEELDFDLRAMRQGSPLDSVLQILDGNLKVVAENDDLAGNQADSRLRFQVPADGLYHVRIAERLADRGGMKFIYRLRVTTAAQPDFELTVPTDGLTVERGKPTNWKLQVDRGPGVNDEITLEFAGLPDGVTVTPAVIAKQQREVNLAFQATEKSKIDCVPISIRATAKVNGQDIVRPVLVAGRPQDDQSQALWLAIALPTPFRFSGVFETKFMPRGSAYVRHYTVQRNGFAGALEARLADNQGRHLQGVTGDPVAISPGQSEFDFTVKLPPFMEIGRTSRTTLSVMGTVVDFDGSQHVVSYSSNAQNDQMIALVDPGRLAVAVEKRTLPVIPGTSGIVSFRLQRSNGLKHPVEVETIIPAGIPGTAAKRVTIPADQSSGQLQIEFQPEAKGPFRSPILLRATTLDERNLPVIADVPIELVPE